MRTSAIRGKQRLAIASATGIASILLARVAPAATIVWGPPTTITGDSDVSTVGALVSAANLGDTSAVVINGVTFAATTSGNSGNFVFATAIGSISNVPSAFGVSAAPFSGLSTSYQDLLDSGIFTHTPPAAPPAITLTINNLAVATPYLFQWWVNDARATGDETRVTTAAAGSSVTLEHNVQNTSGGVGQFTIATFIADAPTQQITFLGAGGGPNVASTQLNAVQLRVVPEPSILGLVGLGLEAICTRRRKVRATTVV